jgi:hypothetical protein
MIWRGLFSARARQGNVSVVLFRRDFDFDRVSAALETERYCGNGVRKHLQEQAMCTI